MVSSKIFKLAYLQEINMNYIDKKVRVKKFHERNEIVTKSYMSVQKKKKTAK